MSATPEKWEEDLDWLWSRLMAPPTEDEEETFCERVALLISEAGMNENDARKRALEMLKN